MLRFAILIGAMLASTSAFASCFGSDSFKTCTDDSGNSYTVNRFGNTTMMQGYNSNTGSNWSQNSQTYGNSTFHQGETNGQSWNMQQNSYGNIQTYQGTDSYGNTINKTCSFGYCN